MTRESASSQPHVEHAWVVHLRDSQNIGDRILGRGLEDLLTEQGVTTTRHHFTFGRSDGVLLRLARRLFNGSAAGVLLDRSRVLFDRHIRRPSVIFIGGGQLLLPNRSFLHGLETWTALGRHFGAPVVLFSVGTEFPEGQRRPEVENRLEAALHRADSVYLRDSHSVTALGSLLRQEPEVVPDVAYGMLPSMPSIARERRLLVFPTKARSALKYGHYESVRDFLSHVSKIVLDEWKGGTFNLVEVAFSDPDDLDMGLALQSSLRGSIPPSSVEIRSPFVRESAFVETIASSRKVISARMHPLIFAHMCGVPFRAIIRNRKLECFHDLASCTGAASLQSQLRSVVRTLVTGLRARASVQDA